MEASVSVVRDWRCFAHGVFESKEDAPLCPVSGCDTVEKVFLTPVAFRSNRTANIDRTVAGLARNHGLSDISNRGGRAAIRQDGAAANRDEEFRDFVRQKYGDGWGNVPKGGSMNVKTQQIQGSGPGAAGAIAAYGAKPENVLEQVKPALVPKPILIRRDHEGLQVPK